MHVFSKVWASVISLLFFRSGPTAPIDLGVNGPQSSLGFAFRKKLPGPEQEGTFFAFRPDIFFVGGLQSVFSPIPLPNQ